jgi:hypothetical protein
MILGLESPVVDFLTHKQNMIKRLQENLANAQASTKKYADKNRTKREFKIGDMIYLKLQPFRHTTFGLHQSLKLTTKFYGPFRIVQRIGPAAYRLYLPQSATMHSVFHVSQLKQHIGPKAVPLANLPMVTSDVYNKAEPEAVLDTRALPRQDNIITQWKI